MSVEIQNYLLPWKNEGAKGDFIAFIAAVDLGFYEGTGKIGS